VAALDQGQSRAFPLHGSSGQHLGEHLSIREFHGHEGPVGRLLTDVVHHDDVGVIEPRGDLGFLLEPRQDIRLGDRASMHQLDRHFPLQRGILRQIDDPHGAATQFAEHLVPTDRGGRGVHHVRF